MLSNEGGCPVRLSWQHCTRRTQVAVMKNMDAVYSGDRQRSVVLDNH
jgi:hypothetical protein